MSLHTENKAVMRFLVQTSDVLDDMRVNVCLDGSSQVIWHKERYLDDKEIVENIIHDATNTICWTIHRPLRGWYIRIRLPMFPPGVFIPLTPVPSSAPYHTEAAMSFNSRTNIPVTIPVQTPEESAELDRENDSKQSQDSETASSSSSTHSYPPTLIPSQSFSNPKAQDTPTRPPPRPVSLIPSSQITQFLLAPSSVPPTQPEETASSAASSFLSHALSVIKNYRPSRSNSFTLCRVLHPPKRDGVSSPPPPYASNTSISSVEQAGSSEASGMSLGQSRPVLNAPLLVFHDKTPVLTLRALTGLIELNQVEERTLGVDTSFWIAIALTYLEFLEEKESYSAAMSD